MKMLENVGKIRENLNFLKKNWKIGNFDIFV
jgi:hypothetical protein